MCGVQFWIESIFLMFISLYSRGHISHVVFVIIALFAQTVLANRLFIKYVFLWFLEAFALVLYSIATCKYLYKCYICYTM